MNARAVERQSIEADLRRALERQELEVHYQPKVSLTTGVVTGLEALVRWRHPTRGLISPARFIPVAEDCRLILPIGAWILAESCRQAQRWTEAGVHFGTMAVNVSALQFCEPGFTERVFGILDDTGLDPQRLELEVTESALLTGAQSVAFTLRALRKRGVHIALDDFGTGYSSLGYLRRFPVDCLKIDQSFVRQICIDSGEAALVTAIIEMAHALGLRVVAEGVETDQEMQFLKARRCDLAQGFFVSRPMTAEAYAQWVERHDNVACVAERERAIA